MIDVIFTFYYINLEILFYYMFGKLLASNDSTVASSVSHRIDTMAKKIVKLARRLQPVSDLFFDIGGDCSRDLAYGSQHFVLHHSQEARHVDHAHHHSQSRLHRQYLNWKNQINRSKLLKDEVLIPQEKQSQSYET